MALFHERKTGIGGQVIASGTEIGVCFLFANSVIQKKNVSVSMPAVRTPLEKQILINQLVNKGELDILRFGTIFSL
jgi:hypothetical protein